MLKFLIYLFNMFENIEVDKLKYLLIFILKYNVFIKIMFYNI